MELPEHGRTHFAAACKPFVERLNRQSSDGEQEGGIV